MSSTTMNCAAQAIARTAQLGTCACVFDSCSGSLIAIPSDRRTYFQKLYDPTYEPSLTFLAETPRDRRARTLKRYRPRMTDALNPLNSLIQSPLHARHE